MTATLSARDVVTSRIAAQARRYPSLDLVSLDTTGLDTRDAALASAIEHAVLRRWLTLTTIIESQLSRPWDELETKMQAALLAGASQLLVLDRIPDHAALNETVEWAKRHIRPKAGGMVNAVLRKVAALRIAQQEPARRDSHARDELPLADGRIWKLSAPVFADAFISRLAQQTSHSEPLLAHWMAAFGREASIALALHNLVLAPIIVHGIEPNPDGSGATPPPLAPHDEPDFHVFTGDRAALLDLLRSHPNSIVQDSTSAAPVQASSRLSWPGGGPRVIIDYCAGRGTKTRQLATTFPDAQIVATDADPRHIEELSQQFAGNARVEVVELGRVRRFDEKADLLVLDVPCSNTGVLARRIEAKYRFSHDSQAKLVNIQRQIIADSIPLLSSRGRLLYATCSVDPAENEQQAAWISRWHRLRTIQSRARLPQGLPGDPPRAYRDGGFFALMERP